jgi:transposase
MLENEKKNKKQVAMDGFIQLSAISKKYGRIRIPIRFNRQINKWRAVGEINSGIILSKNSVTLSFSVPMPEKKEVGRRVGVDQGILNVVTFSDGQTSGPDKDGHTLQSIQNRLSRRKKGSKRFEKAQRHRENYIGWALNSLDFSKINDIRLEKIYQIRKGKKSSRFLSHWTATKIAEKLERLCDENGVRFSLQSCAYRSQRCSACGFVHEKNRKKKVFCCLSCGFLEDADFNASLNHEAELPSVPKRFIGIGLNKGAGGGFYWKKLGFFHADGSELTVPNDPMLNVGFQ